ncbi:MAG: tetratricopeptide repeat protein [Xanthomonadales bacterium]|nr:tetratricopeptide repeat protein [Xanthomonadales bacterium]
MRTSGWLGLWMWVGLAAGAAGDQDRVGPREAVPVAESVLAMPEDLRKAFHAQVLDPPRPPHRRMQLLVDFLFQPQGLGMQYRDDATYSVADAWRTREANCLAFTLLTVALAREAGLHAYGQEIRDAITWRKDADMIYRANHVSAGIRILSERYAIDVAWDEVIASGRPRPIDDHRLIAHFYSNRAVELMRAGNLAAGLAHADAALALDPANPAFLSNRGVLHQRAGEAAAAERDYRAALALNPDHASALSNLAMHHRRAGDDAAATVLLQRLAAVQARDPLHQFLLAADYERRGDWAQALAHYRRAVRLFEPEHSFHYALARVNVVLGHAEAAGRALERARELSNGATRARYQAKLDYLRSRPPQG